MLEIYTILRDRLGIVCTNIILICVITFFLITILCGIERSKDKKKKRIGKEFSYSHPRLNLILGLDLVVGFITIIYIMMKYIVHRVIEATVWLNNAVSSLDVVIIVALITGTVSIIGVIISSIVSKIIDYKKSRKEYLAKKREEPYGEFVEMIYQMQKNVKGENKYSEEMMAKDLAKFSKKITL